MNVKILNSCVGCGACAIINPNVFEIHGNKAIVNPNKIDESDDLCIDAAISCPVNAIEICEY
ncbi:ferredoxin [bacterium]|nr:ferredoxin [bacterium]